MKRIILVLWIMCFLFPLGVAAEEGESNIMERVEKASHITVDDITELLDKGTAKLEKLGDEMIDTTTSKPFLMFFVISLIALMVIGIVLKPILASIQAGLSIALFIVLAVGGYFLFKMM